MITIERKGNFMNFILYLISFSTSMMGSSIQRIIIPIHVLAVTGSGLAMSKAATYFWLIYLVTVPFGGIVADKFNRKYVIIIMDILCGISVGWFALFGDLTVSNIILLQCFIIMCGSIFHPSIQSIFKNLTGNDTDKCMSIAAVSEDIIMVTSPLIAVSLYSAVGLKMIFIINAITFLFSAVVESFLKYNHIPMDTEKTSFNPKQFFAAYKPIMKYMRVRRDLSGVMIFNIFQSMFFNPIHSVFIPFFIMKILVLGEGYVGYFNSLNSVGYLLGSIAMVKIINKYNFKKYSPFIITAKMILIFIYFNAYKFMPMNVYLIVVSIFILSYGLINSCFNMPYIAYMHNTVDTELKGRYFSLSGMIMQSGGPVAIMLLGYGMDKYHDITGMITVYGIFFITITFWYFYKTNLGRSYITTEV